MVTALLVCPSAGAESGWRSRCKHPGRKRAAAEPILCRCLESSCSWAATGCWWNGKTCPPSSTQSLLRCTGHTSPCRDGPIFHEPSPGPVSIPVTAALEARAALEQVLVESRFEDTRQIRPTKADVSQFEVGHTGKLQS